MKVAKGWFQCPDKVCKHVTFSVLNSLPMFKTKHTQISHSIPDF